MTPGGETMSKLSLFRGPASLQPQHKEPQMPISDEEARSLLRDAMRSAGDYYRERGIFQDRFGFGRAPAIVVVDFAYGWTDDAYAGGSRRLDGPVEATR